MRRLEAERLEARQQIEALDSEPKQRIQFWGYWPWLLPVPVFFIIDNLWSRTAAWWLAILALPFLAFPTFVKVNEKILDEKGLNRVSLTLSVRPLLRRCGSFRTLSG